MEQIMHIDMKKYTAILLGLLATFTLAAQPEAVFNKLIKQYTWHSDGSMTFRYRKEVKLNTHVSFNQLYGETFIIYNKDFQTLKINECYTRQADGTIVKAPDNAFNEVLPAFAADAPAYNHLTEMVVTHTGLEIGATIYLDYTITTSVGYYPFLDVAETLQEHAPVTECEISIAVPADDKLTCGISGIDSKEPTTSTNNGVTTYTWTFRNLPAIPLESHTASAAVPMLFASNAGGESGVAWLSAMKVNPLECAPLVEKLLKDISSPTERANAIQRFVVNNIATANLPLLLSADMRTPAVVLASAYGTPAEKAGLMASMLMAAGLDAQILAAFPLHAMPIAASALTDIRVRTGGRFLSPVRMDAPDPALRATRDQFWMTGEDGVSMVQIDGRAASLACTAQITLGAKEATVDGTLTDSEDAAAKPDFTGKSPLQSAAGYTVYTLPAPRRHGVDAWRLTLNSTRTQPYELPSAIRETCEYMIDLGGRELKTLPFRKEWSGAVGKVCLTLQHDGDKVRVLREIELTHPVIAPEEYADFRTLILLWQDDAYRKLILKDK